MDAAPDASFGTLDLDEGLSELIEPELATGERLLWAGRSGMNPLRGSNRDLFASLAAGLICVAFCGGWILLAPDVRGPSKFAEPLGNLFLLSAILAVGLLVTTFLLWRSRRSATRRATSQTYGLTDRRVIRWAPGLLPETTDVISIPFNTIKVAALVRTQRTDGSGDLVLRGPYDKEAVLRSIPDVRRVERLLRENLPRSSWKTGAEFETENISDISDQNLAF